MLHVLSGLVPNFKTDLSTLLQCRTIKCGRDFDGEEFPLTFNERTGQLSYFNFSLCCGMRLLDVYHKKSYLQVDLTISQVQQYVSKFLVDIFLGGVREI